MFLFLAETFQVCETQKKILQKKKNPVSFKHYYCTLKLKIKQNKAIKKAQNSYLKK